MATVSFRVGSNIAYSTISTSTPNGTLAFDVGKRIIYLREDITGNKVTTFFCPQHNAVSSTIVQAQVLTNGANTNSSCSVTVQPGDIAADAVIIGYKQNTISGWTAQGCEGVTLGASTNGAGPSWKIGGTWKKNSTTASGTTYSKFTVYYVRPSTTSW